MNYIKSLVAGAIVLGVSFPLAAQESLTLPEQVFPQLNETLQRAVKESPRMVMKKLDLAAAEGDLQVAKSGLYPTIGGYYQFTFTQDHREDIPGQTLDTQKQAYDLRLTQPIYHWNERLNNSRIGELRKKIADENYLEGYGQLAQEIRAAYLRIIVSKASLVQARFDRDLAEAQMHVAEDKLAKKVISPGEYAQTGIETDQSRLRADSAEADFDRATLFYANLTGGPRVNFDEVPDDIPVATDASKAAVQSALGEFLSRKDTDTRSLTILKQSADIDDLTYKNAKKRLYPKLSFILGMNLDQQSYTINNAAKYSLRSEYVGILVNWTIFDGFATRGAIASSLARKRQSEQTYKDAASRIGQDAQNAEKIVSLAYRQAEIDNRILESKRNFLRLQKDTFVRGGVSDTEVGKAQSDYNASLVIALASRSAYLMRIGDYLAVTSQDPILNKVTARGSK